MILKEVVNCLEAVVVNGEEKLEQNCTGVYISDLLSDVMGHAKEGEVWITIQTHTNVVAVALLLNLAAVVFTAGTYPDSLTIEKGKEEGIVLLSTKLTTFEAAGRLYQTLQ
ncbi:MAG TPA: serine kinase [Firmicutes bacterium]|jgi:predicted transcriptional regulator|nr:serine kinase [Bacillota bacterium]HBK67544.1 serine kinase [Bacillota bacterium]